MGRYDARYTSYTLDRLAERTDFDATDSAIDAAFVGAGNYFLRDILGYHTNLVYRPLINVFRQWDWKHNGNLPTNTAQDLANAMVFNPNLRVFSANGYFDFATPFFATVYTLNHLNLPPQLQRTSPTASTSPATWSTCTRRRSRSSTTISSAGTRKRSKPVVSGGGRSYQEMTILPLPAPAPPCTFLTCVADGST